MQKPKNTLVSSAVITLFISGAANAGGFSLYTEGSTVAIGNYAAGIAAEAADASIGWYNPAGLVLIRDQQLVVSGAGVFPSTKVSGSTVFASPGVPPYVQTFADIQSSKSAFVPALHYAHPLGDKATFGLSITSPFGLSSEYNDSSAVRYAATFSELLTTNVSPEIGGRLSENFAVGAGLDLQWAQVKFNRMLGSPALLQYLQKFGGPLTPTFFDSQSYNKGHSFGVGFHAGVMGMFNENHTRLGLNYQSSMKHRFNGFSQLTGRLADPALTDKSAVFRSDDLFADPIRLPQVVTLSAYQDVSNQWALLGSVVYTGWDSFKEIRLNKVAAASTATVPPQVLVSSNTEQNFRNAWRFAVGANYRVNDQWLVRFGGGFDQTPTVNEDRDLRLPDADRWALSIGTHYQAWPAVGFDVGYTYLWAPDDAIIDRTDSLGTSTYAVDARAKAHAHLLGVQAVWTIDKNDMTAK